jgi:hypothetical protein
MDGWGIQSNRFLVLSVAAFAYFSLRDLNGVRCNVRRNLVVIIVVQCYTTHPHLITCYQV